MSIKLSDVTYDEDKAQERSPYYFDKDGQSLAADETDAKKCVYAFP